MLVTLAFGLSCPCFLKASKGDLAKARILWAEPQGHRQSGSALSHASPGLPQRGAGAATGTSCTGQGLQLRTDLPVHGLLWAVAAPLCHCLLPRVFSAWTGAQPCSGLLRRLVAMHWKEPQGILNRHKPGKQRRYLSPSLRRCEAFYSNRSCFTGCGCF